MDRQSQTSFLNQFISLFMVNLNVFFFWGGGVFSSHMGLKDPRANTITTFWTKGLKI